VKLTQTITAMQSVAAPRPVVWEVFCRVMDWPQWNPLVSRTRWPAGGQLSAGGPFSFGIKLRPLGLPVMINARVEELVPQERVVWTGGWGGIRARHRFSFRDLADGCLVQSHEVLTGWGLLPARLLYSPRRLSQLTGQWLGALARQAEASLRRP